LVIKDQDGFVTKFQKIGTKKKKYVYNLSPAMEEGWKGYFIFKKFQFGDVIELVIIHKEV
jgi:hypothetical protein